MARAKPGRLRWSASATPFEVDRTTTQRVAQLRALLEDVRCT